MISSAVLRYVEGNVRRLWDGMVQSTMESLLKTAAKEAKKGVLSPVYRAVEDRVKQAVDRGAPNNAISSRHNSLTES